MVGENRGEKTGLGMPGPHPITLRGRVMTVVLLGPSVLSPPWRRSLISQLRLWLDSGGLQDRPPASPWPVPPLSPRFC